MGPQEHPEWRGATRSDTGAPKMSLLAKMTKMPLSNLGFNKGKKKGQNPQKITPFIVFHQTRTSRRFLATLTKFDSKLTLGGPKNPNFDLAIGMGWNQCHGEYYQILIPRTIRGSKSELDRLKYHENRVNASIDALLTFQSHNFWFDRWIFEFHPLFRNWKSRSFQERQDQPDWGPFEANGPWRATASKNARRL